MEADIELDILGELDMLDETEPDKLAEIEALSDALGLALILDDSDPVDGLDDGEDETLEEMLGEADSLADIDGDAEIDADIEELTDALSEVEILDEIDGDALTEELTDGDADMLEL
jgi:hypothetical protein